MYVFKLFATSRTIFSYPLLSLFASGFRNCILLFLQSQHQETRVINLHNYNSMFVSRTTLSLSNTLFLRHFYRTFNNIRKNSASSPTSSAISPQQIGQVNVSIGSKITIPNMDISSIPNPQPPTFQNTQDSKTHLIFKSIKDAQNTSTLFHVLRKHRHHLQIEHILGIFEKFVYFSNNSKVVRVDGVDIYQRNHDMAIAISSQLFKKTRPPQLYIRFIWTCSIIANEDLNCQFLPIMMRVFKEQLNNKNPEQKKEEGETKNSQKQGEEGTFIHQIISIQSNIKLIQSIIRILNTRAGQIKQEDETLLMGLLKNSINYVHVPASPDRLENHLLWDLITQYLKIDNLKLGSPVVKALVHDCLKRLKYEDLFKKINTLEKPIAQSYIVKSIKKLLVVEKLLLKQTRRQAMQKEIIETKTNNLAYNSFYCVENKISKYISELLPKCQFSSQTQTFETYWQHIDLLPLLQAHFRTLFVQIPIDVISKCDLLSASYQQYESCIIYLKNLYAHVVRTRLLATGNDKRNLARMLAYSYRLLYLLMSGEVTCHIPTPVLHKSLQSSLMSQLIKYFTQIPPGLKMFVIWHILDKNNDTELAKQLLNNLTTSALSSHDQNTKIQSDTEFLWFFRLLATHPKYLELTKQTDFNEEQFSISCLKNLIKNIPEYQELYATKAELNLESLATILGQKIKHSESRTKHLNSILKQYQKISINNCLLPQRLATLLKKHKIYLQKSETQKQQKTQRVLPPRSAVKLKEQLLGRIEECLSRAELLFKVVTIACSEKPQYSNYKAQIARLYTQEISLLNYPTVMRKNHLDTMEKLNKQADTYKESTSGPEIVV